MTQVEAENGSACLGGPDGLWSLLDMIERHGLNCFNASNLLRALQFLHRSGKNGLVDLPMYRQGLAEHVQTCEALGLRESQKLLNRIISDWDAGEYELLQQRDRFGVLHERIRDELDSVWFKVLSQVEATLYQSVAPFGDSVSKSFPSAVYDIQEASKCLALARSTACVLHAMRVLQMGLNALATALNVPFERKDWNVVIEKIESEITQSRKQKLDDATKEWLEFCSESAIEFRYFKDAWRNHAMHARESYTPERALQIYNHVAVFMQHISERLSE